MSAGEGKGDYGSIEALWNDIDGVYKKSCIA